MRPAFVVGAALALTVTACAEDGGGGAPAVRPVAVDAAPAGLKRLTAVQYERALAAMFGPEVVVNRPLEPDVGIEGLIQVGAGQAAVSPWGVEQYEKVAFDVAAQVVDDASLRKRWLPCTPADVVDADCAEAGLANLAEQAWRRPPEPAELSNAGGDPRGVVDLAGAAAETLDDFYEGLKYGVVAVLQSPHFLYRVELGEPVAEGAERRRYGDYEMASRLAFFLWNAPPDQWLREQAAAGRLTSDEGLAQAVAAMQADPRYRDGVRAFFADLLALHELDHVSKDPVAFPHFAADYGASAREETLRVAAELVIDDDGDYRELFTQRSTWINRRLGAIYGVPVPDLEGFNKVTFAESSMRAGLLGHASMLALHSHPKSTSATLRGRFIRETLLCGEIPPPAADVNTAIPEPSPDLPTLRDRVAVHLESPSCAACHSNMDPIGLGLENFDAIGGPRLRERDVRIDASGDLDGEPFAGPKELGEAVAQHPDLGNCLVRNVVRYATGTIEGRGQVAAIGALSDAFAANGYRVARLMHDVALHDVFRTATAPGDELAGGAEPEGESQ